MASSPHVVRVVRTADRPGHRDGEGSDSGGMTAIIPAPVYSLPRATWIPTLVIWRADGRFTRLEGDPCEDYAAARAASWRRRPTLRHREPA
jgi:hypothetical protein